MDSAKALFFKGADCFRCNIDTLPDLVRRVLDALDHLVGNEGVVEVAENTFVSADARFVVVRGANAEQTRIVTENMIRDGAADFVVIDSLANLVPNSRREGKQMIRPSSPSYFSSTIISTGKA